MFISVVQKESQMNNKNGLIIIVTAFFITSNIRASLSVQPAKFSESVAPGKTKTVQLLITNLGPAASLGYTINSTANWLNITPTSGTVTVNQTATVDVTLNAANLIPGKYTSSITVGDPHHGPITVPVELNVSTTTDVKDIKEKVPQDFILYQNYPNPFNPSTQIMFQVPESQNVEIKVYDIIGNEITTLAAGIVSAGIHSVKFEGGMLSSGIYFYTLRANNYSLTKKMVLTK